MRLTHDCPGAVPTLQFQTYFLLNVICGSNIKFAARRSIMANSMPPAINTNYIRFDDDNDDFRSPRTPNWAPMSPTLTSPFDYTKFFATSPAEPPSNLPFPPQPDNPLPWIWQCHLCRNRYPLGVTRRCLYDGHYYCSGGADQPNLKKKKKGVACSSEFDYDGWEDYGDWRRQVLQLVPNPRILMDCETCDFPSQCRTPLAISPRKKSKKAVPPVVLKMPEPSMSDITTIDPKILTHPCTVTEDRCIMAAENNTTESKGGKQMLSQKESTLEGLMISLSEDTHKSTAKTEKPIRKKLRKQRTTSTTTTVRNNVA